MTHMSNESPSSKSECSTVLILRVWAEETPSAGNETNFRFRLEDIRTGSHWAFSTYEKLLQFLNKRFNHNEKKIRS